MVSHIEFRSVLDVGVYNNLFANGKRAVAGVGDLHQAAFVDYFNHLARKIGVFGVKRLLGLFLTRANSNHANSREAGKQNLFHRFKSPCLVELYRVYHKIVEK